jgi:acyl-CoA synthetase (AMP-forming)/AMP-acid ligase II
MRPPIALGGAFISDGVRACAYADLDSACDSVDRFLAIRNVDRDACLAVACANNLASVITTLTLLRRGIGFALCSPDQPAPVFCRYVVDCRPPHSSSSDIANCLQLRENGSWGGTAASYRGRFYTRTSGTTAVSKTVVFSHSRLWANARNCVGRFQLSGQERVAIPVPIWHMYGLGAGLLPALLANASIDIQANSNVIRYLQRETEFQPTTVYLTPGFCYALTRLPQAHRRYRLTIAAGDRTPADIFARYEEAHGCLVSLYGSSELGAVAAGSPDDPFQLRSHSTGLPMPGVRVSHCTASPPDGEYAELCFDHPFGGDGYADERGEVIDADDRFREGRLKSNDLGRVGTDGYLRVAGRSDHLVKRDGRFVAFSDVEEALLKNAVVEAAVVLSDGTTPRGARLTAVCVARSGDADVRAIREESRRHLPAYAIPDRITLVDEIPRLESGKPDRAALARQMAAASPG